MFPTPFLGSFWLILYDPVVLHGILPNFILWCDLATFIFAMTWDFGTSGLFSTKTSLWHIWWSRSPSPRGVREPIKGADAERGFIGFCSGHQGWVKSEKVMIIHDQEVSMFPTPFLGSFWLIPYDPVVCYMASFRTSYYGVTLPHLFLQWLGTLGLQTSYYGVTLPHLFLQWLGTLGLQDCFPPKHHYDTYDEVGHLLSEESESQSKLPTPSEASLASAAATKDGWNRKKSWSFMIKMSLCFQPHSWVHSG